MARSFARFAPALFALLLGGAPMLAVDPPAPVSAAERAGVEAAADFMSRGPIALFERLSSDSPLRAMPQPRALEQIEIVTGPPNDATWELCTQQSPEVRAVFHVFFPSGVDDYVTLDMVERDGSWKIGALHMYAEVPSFLVETPSAMPIADILKGSGPHLVLDERPPHDYRPLIGALIVAVLAFIARFFSPALSRALAIVAVACFGLQVYVAMKPEWRLGGMRMVEGGEEQPAVKPLSGGASSGALLAFRREMASRLDAAPKGTLANHEQSIASLWQCQLALARGDRKAATTLLGGDLRAPLASLLQARMLAGRSDQRARAAKAYDDALNHGVYSDSLALEKVMTTSTLEFSRSSRVMSDPLRLRSRDADVYYMRAIEAMVADNALEAGESMRIGWALRPSTREHLVSTSFAEMPAFADQGMLDMVRLHAPDEAKVRDAELSARAIAVPQGTVAVASGRFLRLTVGTSVLDVPGGAALAPPETAVVAATYFAAAEEREALAAFEKAKETRAPADAAPFASWELERVAAALAAHNRWEDLAGVTRSVTPDATGTSADLFCLRLTALLKLGRTEEARSLAQGPLAKSLRENLRDATIQVFIAEALARTGSYMEAIDLYKRSRYAGDAAQAEIRIRQLELLVALKSLPPVTRTAHFELRCSPDVTLPLANRIAEILESELRRLQPVIGLKEFSPIVVNVIGWDDFRQNVTGSDHVMGIYDGEITIPFATATRFNPEIVSVLSHELTHAIVAQASRDNAPRWFQEGIASRMELVDGQKNIFGTRGASDLIPFMLIDATLMSTLDPVKSVDAYTHAQTVMRFLESRYGRGVLSKVIAAYREGASTDEALQRATGRQSEELDREFREWGSAHRDPFRLTERYPYDKFYSPGVDPGVLSGIKFSTKGR